MTIQFLLFRNLCSLLLTLCCLSSTLAKTTGFEIRVQLENFDHKQIYLAQYYAGVPEFLDTVQLNAHKQFVFSGDEQLQDGLYLLVLPPRNKAIQIALSQNDQQFEVFADANNISADHIKTTGSETNAQFYSYLVHLRSKRKELDALRKSGADLTGKAQKKLDKNIRKMIREIRDFQLSTMRRAPDSPAALMASIDMEPEFPDFKGSEEEVREQRHRYQKVHFFDAIDPANSRLAYTPLFFSKINFYVSRMTRQETDSVTHAVDQVLHLFEADSTNYKALISYFTRLYRQSRVVGLDAVYVYLYDQYYKSGKVNWLTEEQVKSVHKQAEIFRPILIGKKAPDIQVQRRDGQSIRLHEIQSDYTVLYFWRPACGHCKKATPKVKEFYEKYKDLGVEILSVCTQHGDGVQGCWDYIDEHDIDQWIQTVDKYHRSKFMQKFNAQRTPKIYVLDKDKHILIKDFDAQKLPEVLDRMMNEHPPKSN